MAQKTVAYTTGVTPGAYTSADITVDNQGLITTVASGSGGSAPANTWLPSTYVPGGITWTADPVFYPAQSQTFSTGTLAFATLKLPSAISVSNISFYMAQNTATWTAGRNFVALYVGNAVVAQSADQTATWQGSGIGIKTTALVGAPIALSAGEVRVAVMGGYSAGSGAIATRTAASGFINTMGAAPNLRIGSQFPVTSLPADLNSTVTTTLESWFCLS